MKIINARKYIPYFFAFFLIAHSSNAVGLATGPSLGMAGFYTSFDTKSQLDKVSIDNLALQVGWFAKLDVWLLYTKLDTLFILNWQKLPNQNREHFKYITIPLTIGVPVLSLLRPHIGLIACIPLFSLDNMKFKGNSFIESCSNKLNGYILGLGIDLGKFSIDLHCKFARLSVARKNISVALSNGDKHYRPKQFTLIINYNLLS